MDSWEKEDRIGSKMIFLKIEKKKRFDRMVQTISKNTSNGQLALAIL